MTIISIANQKGGVGKTTTAINLSAAFAVMGKKVLLIDLDPQGNASTGVGIEREDGVGNIYDVFLDDKNIKDCIRKSYINNLNIVSSCIDLAAIDVELSDMENKEIFLKKILNEIKNDFDFIFIDCPPSLGCLTVNAMSASDSVLIPMQCEFFSLEGLAHLIRTIELVKNSLNPNLRIEGILLTMVDRRNKLTIQVEEDVRTMFDNLVYDTTIPRNVRLSEAPSHGQPAIVYDIKCLGSMAYLMLVREIIKKR